MKKLSAPSLKNFRNINRCLFEATNNAVYLSYNSNYSFILSLNGITFLELFYNSYNELKTFVNNGGIFKYNLVNLDGEKIPFLYNNL
jgi:hypothetical protein